MYILILNPLPVSVLNNINFNENTLEYNTIINKNIWLVIWPHSYGNKILLF